MTIMTDIAIPKNNENEFIEIASRLNIKKLYFLYDFDEFTQKNQKISNLRENKNISLETGFLINQKNSNQAAKLSKLLVAKSSENDRFFVESKKIRLIYGFEEVDKKDYLHQRASGLNHILCEIAKKNNVAIGFSYSSLFNKNKSISSILIGRMMQNIQLCRKYKCEVTIASFAENSFHLRAPHDIKSLFSLLGFVGDGSKFI